MVPEWVTDICAWGEDIKAGEEGKADKSKAILYSVDGGLSQVASQHVPSPGALGMLHSEPAVPAGGG